MNEVESCKKIFLDLQDLLNDRKYKETSEYLQTLYDGTISEMKSALIMTKSFKEHEILKDSRKSLLESFENKMGHKSF